MGQAIHFGNNLERPDTRIFSPDTVPGLCDTIGMLALAETVSPSTFKQLIKVRREFNRFLTTVRHSDGQIVVQAFCGRGIFCSLSQSSRIGIYNPCNGKAGLNQGSEPSRINLTSVIVAHSCYRREDTSDSFFGSQNLTAINQSQR